MGIDICAKWATQTEEEREAQITSLFDVTKGRVGYLREAYHGEPYATRILVAEAFDADSREAEIPAAVMRSRLPDVIQAAMLRSRQIYRKEAMPDDPCIKSFTDFVDLCQRKETETGKPCTIVASY